MAKNPTAPETNAPTAPADVADRGVPITLHLDRAVSRKLKHAAIDAETTPSKLVSQIVAKFLA
jgi:hypothetical protein